MKMIWPLSSLFVFLRKTNGMPVKFLTSTIVFVEFASRRPTNTVIDVLLSCLALVLAYSIPLIELFEYLEFGFVTRWEGDFFPRARRLLGKFRSSDDADRCSKNIEPPRLAEFLVGTLAKKRYRDGLLQCFDHGFQNDLANGLSLRRAQARYWAATLNSIGPQLWVAVKRIGVIGLLFR